MKTGQAAGYIDGGLAQSLVGALSTAIYAVFLAACNAKFLIVLAIWMCPSVGVLGNFYSFQLGSLQIRLSGIVNSLLLLGAAFYLVAHFREMQGLVMRKFRLFFLFVAFAALRVIDSPDKGLATKDVLLILTPIAIGVTAELAIVRGVDPAWIEKQILLSPLLTLTILAIQFLNGASGYDQYGLTSLLGKGTIALFGLPVFALALSQWRYVCEKKWPFYVTALALGLILLTVSRMASAIAVLVLLPLRFIKFNRTFLLNCIVMISLACLASLAVLQVPAMRYRFMEDSEPRAWSPDEEIINTSGRSTLWIVTIDDALKRPVLGYGTGSSEVLIPERVPGLEHPHNDYLRIWHDLGLFGLLLFISAWAGRVNKHFRMWRTSDRHPVFARRHMAAALAAVVVVLSYLSDNTLLYTFVQVPVFLLFAAADCCEGKSLPNAELWRGKNQPEKVIENSIWAI